jgi:hypothetical protein
MADTIVGVITEVFNAASGEGYTRDYDDPQGTFWLALRYMAVVDYNGLPTSIPVNASSLDRYLPPVRVRSLTLGSEVVGFVFDDRIRWHFHELPAVGCRP